MDIQLGELVCTYPNANQGTGGLCKYTQAPIIYGLAIPKGATITAANFADIKAFLRTQRTLNDPFARWYLTPRFNEINANLEDANIVSAPDRSKFVTINESWDLGLTIWNATMCTHQNMMNAFDNSQDRYDWLFIDANYILVGQKTTNATAPFAIEMGGFPTQLARVLAQTPSQFDATPNTALMLSLPQIKELQKNWFVADISNIGFVSDAIAYNVSNIAVTSLTATGANTFTFTLVTGCGNTPLGKNGYLRTQLLQVGAYDILVNGVAVIPSNIAIDAVTGIGTATVTATTGQSVDFGLKPVMTLAGLTTPLKFYEVPVPYRKSTVAL